MIDFRLKLKPNKEHNTLNEVHLNELGFYINDTELKTFIISVIDERPDILQEEYISNRLLNILNTEEELEEN